MEVSKQNLPQTATLQQRLGICAKTQKLSTVDQLQNNITRVLTKNTPGDANQFPVTAPVLYIIICIDRLCKLCNN